MGSDGSDGYWTGVFAQVSDLPGNPARLSTVPDMGSLSPVASRTLDRAAEWRRVEARARDEAHQAVEVARMLGATWAQVGQALGITRQSAQQRFGGAGRRRGLSDARGRFSLELRSEGARPA